MLGFKPVTERYCKTANELLSIELMNERYDHCSYEAINFKQLQCLPEKESGLKGI